MPQPQRGGWGTTFRSGLPPATLVYIPHSAVVISFEAASTLRTREKGGGRERPPKKQGGHAARYRWHLGHASVPAPMGSLTSSFIPAGRLRTGPLSPRASSCRIGPRLQGFASPLRALDRSGPIWRDALFTREKGDFGPCGRAEREPFGHTSRLEPQPRGAVTRRAVAQRRSRASGLTRPWAEAIRGFDSGFGVDFVVGPLARSAAVRSKSFVFSFLPIRKVLVLPFRGASAPSSSAVSLLFSVSYPQDRRFYYLFL